MSRRIFDVHDAVNQIRHSKTPLRRVKDKALRAELARALSPENDWLPEARLRAELALGKPASSELIDARVLRAALSLEDCAASVTRLSIRRSLIDADEVFKALRSLLNEASRVNITHFVAHISRSVNKWRTSQCELTLPSFVSYCAVLETALQRARDVERHSRKPLPSNVRGALANLVVFAIANRNATSADEPVSAMLRVLLAAEAVIEDAVQRVLEDSPELKMHLDWLVDAAHQLLDRHAANGHRTALTSLATLLFRVRVTETATRERLLRIYADRAVLAPAIQRALAGLLDQDIQADSAPLDVESSTSVRSQQLASALVRSYVAASTSTQAREAFEELESVLKNFFGIEMKGRAGNEVRFDPAAHEIADPSVQSSSRARVLRPRVDVAQGAISAVLIKALVEPID